jgi:hypothetical protein
MKYLKVLNFEKLFNMDEETLKAIENYRGFGKRDSLVIGF